MVHPDPDDLYGTRAPARLEDVLRRSLGGTPYWLVSLAAHGLVAVMLLLIVVEAPPALASPEVIVSAPEEVERLDETPPEPDAEAIESVVELPDAVTDIPAPAEIEDGPPDRDQNGVDVAAGDPEFRGTVDLESRYSNVAIGVGGGPSGPWGQRGTGGKRDSGGPIGGRRPFTHMEQGLRWLVRHQAPDGSWSCDRFQTCCKKNLCDGRGSSAAYTPGTSALALLAFLGEGNSLRAGRYREVVKRACGYLKAIQSPDGCVGPKSGDGHYIYNHAIATMALAEAYGLSGQTPSLKGSAQQAVDFLVSCQNPYLGWRYGIRPGDNDTSITGWAVLALKSAKLSGLTVPPEAFAGAKNWLEKATDPSYFRTGYTQRGDNGARLAEAQGYRATEAMTAAALAARIFMGAPADDPAVRGAATILRLAPPRWEPGNGNDFYYWYYGALAMFQLGGEDWRVWKGAMEETLVKSQRRGGDEDGSWDPCDAWGHAGGRVYATAINTLTLQIYYRYGKVLGGGR